MNCFMVRDFLKGTQRNGNMGKIWIEFPIFSHILRKKFEIAGHSIPTKTSSWLRFNLQAVNAFDIFIIYLFVHFKYLLNLLVTEFGGSEG